jgi:hypothetical protein
MGIQFTLRAHHAHFCLDVCCSFPLHSRWQPSKETFTSTQCSTTLASCKPRGESLTGQITSWNTLNKPCTFMSTRTNVIHPIMMCKVSRFSTGMQAGMCPFNTAVEAIGSWPCPFCHPMVLLNRITFTCRLCSQSNFSSGRFLWVRRFLSRSPNALEYSCSPTKHVKRRCTYRELPHKYESQKQYVRDESSALPEALGALEIGRALPKPRTQP